MKLARALAPQQVWLGILDIFTHVNPDLPPLSPASLVEVYIPELSKFFAGVYRTLWLLN
ncbi:MAG: hypothetical protein HYX89_02035 [Chloroflexi bacterium]|nr:hypothetical protein [Chloroflexota bacterium]